MVKFSLEYRNYAADEGESSGRRSKRVKHASDPEEADDGVDESANSEEARRVSDDEEDEEEVANVLNSARPTTDTSVSVILTDPEVLDCSICYETLAVPVFQCENGHIACSTCCTELENKCAFCSFPIGYNRCRAIEKVIESMKVMCRNSRYGCSETLLFSSRKQHEDMCIHSPYTCPIDGCNFLDSSQQLSRHLSARHFLTVKQIKYHQPIPLVLNKDCRVIILQEETEGALFVLNNSCETDGNSLTVKYVGSKMSNRVFSYSIMAGEDDCNLRVQSVMKFHSSLFGVLSRYLLVPHGFFNSHRRLKIDLCIQKSDAR